MDADDQLARGRAFQRLHEGPDAFVVPNPWDAGTARALTQLGFQALATTSAGLAFALGRKDGANLLDRAETLLNCRLIVDATHLPVSADLESGFGESPDEVMATIRLAAEAGLVGGSIEDATGRDDEPVLPLDQAVDRVAAAVEAARALPFPFTLTARCESYTRGDHDLEETIARLRAYERAGADVLYAPGLPDLDAISAVCRAVQRPVNVLAAWAGPEPSVAQLAAAGARRISLGGALPRVALTALVRAAEEIRDEGTFGFAAETLSYRQANEIMAGPDRP